MRYELRLTAFDMLDQVHVSMALYETPEQPFTPSTLAFARTATTRGVGRTDMRGWVVEALTTALHALDTGEAEPDATGPAPGGSS